MGSYAALASIVNPVELARTVAAQFRLPFGKMYMPARMMAMYYPAWIFDAQLTYKKVSAYSTY